MPDSHGAVDVSGPLLVFGGPYGNLQATRAALGEAERRGIPPSNVICTGDLAAYCAQPNETIALVRESGIRVVLGNCDEQLGGGAGDCGCGLPEGGACDRLSAEWFNYCSRVLDPRHKPWLSRLPRRIDVAIGPARLAAVHGGVGSINRFVFATSPLADKRAELATSGMDGIIGGHCGLPFSQAIDSGLWHNAGVVGMPANDGTPRVWLSVLSPEDEGIRIEHVALDYDHASAAASMLAAGLPSGYREALSSGRWPSDDILPPAEREAAGVSLHPGTCLWPWPGRAGQKISAPLWPGFHDLMGKCSGLQL